MVGCKTTSEVNIVHSAAAQPSSTASCYDQETAFDAWRNFDLDAARSKPSVNDGANWERMLDYLVAGKGKRPGEKDTLGTQEDAQKRDWNALQQAVAWMESDYATLDWWENRPDVPDPSEAQGANSFRGLKAPFQLTFPDTAFSLPLYFNNGNNPLVDVTLNGKSFRFWIDTGAGVNVISSKVASLAGINPPESSGIQMGTATKHSVNGQMATADELALGPLKAQNVPFMILDKRDLTVRLLGIPVVRIDGIIGWPFLKELDVELDTPGQTLTVRKPQVDPVDQPNLFWYWQPIFRIPTSKGCFLHLKVDTGSSATFFYPSAYPKMGREVEKTSRLLLGGAGGKEMIKVDQLSDCQFWLGGEEVTLKYAEGRQEAVEPGDFFELDGIIGQDILSLGSLRLDFVNRRFVFEFADEANENQ